MARHQIRERAEVSKIEFVREMDALKRVVTLYTAEVQDSNARATKADGTRAVCPAPGPLRACAQKPHAPRRGRAASRTRRAVP